MQYLDHQGKDWTMALRKEMDEQLKSILLHIEKLKTEIEKYLTDYTERDKKTSLLKKNPVKKKKRKLNPALMQVLNATDALAFIVGAKRITRQEAIKHFWDYVKKKKLQDPKDRRNINLDVRLKKAFGNKNQVTMFEAVKLISKNLKK